MTDQNRFDDLAVKDKRKHKLGHHQNQSPRQKGAALNAAGKTEIFSLQVGKVAKADQTVFTAGTDRHGKAAMNPGRLAGTFLELNLFVFLSHQNYLLHRILLTIVLY